MQFRHSGIVKTLKAGKNVIAHIRVLISRKVVPKRRQEISDTRCIVNQKSADLLLFAAEAWCHANSVQFGS
jgi:hypothetical protein